MKNQKESVFEVIVKLFGVPTGKVTLTIDQKREIAEIVTNMMENGECALKPEAFDKYNTHDLLRDEYVVGMVNNWLLKDERLNGNVKHTIKNPGSRSKDATLKNLRSLLKKCTSPEDRAKVEAAIEARQQEIKPKNKEEFQIDENMIPQSLRYLLKA